MRLATGNYRIERAIDELHRVLHADSQRRQGELRRKRAMKVKIRNVGGGHGVVIPKRILLALGLKSGDSVEINASHGKLLVTSSERHPRAGWAEDSKRLAEAGEGGLVWPEFPNEGDKDLKW